VQWSDEWLMIRAAALAHGVDAFFLAAIRQAENGGPGKEFGVLTIKAPTYSEQLEAACATVRNRMVERPPRLRVRLLKSGISRLCLNDDWIGWFASRWAPLGAANDPHELNPHWVDNVCALYARAMNQEAG
jgi:hypothetical protein